MTLNASGPLSFGGATTGQSINLELGVSATALASIDSTSFRTLANVPSGAISVSNFYGKSNSFGWISYITGAGNQTSNTQFFADASGNTYISYKGGTSADYSACARIDINGATATYLRPYADDFVNVNIPAASTNYTGSGAFFTHARADNIGGFPYAILNSSLGYQSGKFVGGGMTYPSRQAITPDGRSYVMGRVPGKAASSKIICLGLNGANLGGWSGGPIYECAVAPRTDNGAYWIYKYGGGLFWASLPAGGGPVTGKQSTFSWSDGGYGIAQAGADSSNNLYAITAQGRLFKINSAFTSITGCFVNTTDLQASMAVYGSFVYVLTTTNSYNAANLYCYDLSLTPQWKNTFTFSNNNCSSQTARLIANANGIFTIFNNNVYGNFIMKIPLTGVPASGSKALTAPSGVTFTYTKTTFSVTGLAFNPIANRSDLSDGGYSNSSSSLYPAGSTTAPANTNTPL